jgi:hypothetical protein
MNSNNCDGVTVEFTLNLHLLSGKGRNKSLLDAERIDLAA